jgi:hypothetical protein
MYALQRDPRSASAGNRLIASDERHLLVSESNLLRIEIVRKNHPLYQQGRKLARSMYQKI